MTIEEMKQCKWPACRPDSIPVRKIMLDKSGPLTGKSCGNCQRSIDYIDWKQNFYDEVVRQTGAQ